MVDLDGANVWPVLGPAYTVPGVSPRAEKVENIRNTVKFFDWTFNHGDNIVRRIVNASLPEALNKAVHDSWAAIKGPGRRPIWDVDAG
ncbi:type 2 periplasmic-binding domain-containing protein [Craurococcus roseus]